MTTECQHDWGGHIADQQCPAYLDPAKNSDLRIWWCRLCGALKYQEHVSETITYHYPGASKDKDTAVLIGHTPDNMEESVCQQP